MGGGVVVENLAGSNLYHEEDIGVRKAAVITTKKSQATMTLAWLRTKVSQRCFGSGVRTGLCRLRYLPTVRGETRMVSFRFNSLAIRSSPQVGFSAAISRRSLRRSLGIRGLATGRDFQRQRRWNPL